MRLELLLMPQDPTKPPHRHDLRGAIYGDASPPSSAPEDLTASETPPPAFAEPTVAEIRDGRAAVEVLFQLYRDRLIRHLMVRGLIKTDAEDAIHEAFVRFLTKLRYLKDDDKLCIILFRLANDEFAHYGRRWGRRKRIQNNIRELVREPPQHTPGSKSDPFARDRLRTLMLMSFVSPEELDILWLYAVERFTWKEVAEVHKITTGAAQQRFNRLKKKLKSEWRNLFGEDWEP